MDNITKAYLRLLESTQHPMIDVDGEKRHRHNSIGHPIHPTDEGIRNFHRWFGDSKSVDTLGRPQVVYHGTNAHVYSGGDIESFNTNNERGASFFSNRPEIAKQYGERVYSTYLALKNPLIVDGKGKHWSDLDKNSPVMGSITPELHKEDQRRTDDLNQLSSEFGDLFGDSEPVQRKFHGLTELNHKLSDVTDKTSTDDVAKHAKRLGYDGVIFKNIQDSPVYDKHMYKPVLSDVYAVFKSSNIKSVNNSGEFGDTHEISN